MCERLKILAIFVALAGLASASAAWAGDLDPSFGNQGLVMTDVGGWDSVTDILLQPDGKILVAGTIDWNGTRNPFLVRYRGDGALDPDFGSAGRVVLTRYTQPGPRIALQSDGKILLATRSDDAPVGLLLLRFEPDGTPDPGFGADGAALIPSLVVNSIAGVGIDGDGAITVGAWLSLGSGEAIGIARFAANGSPDGAFGVGGLLAVQAAYSWIPLTMTVDPGGRIVMGGYAFGLPGRFFTDAFVARFGSDGALDSSFGTGGIVFIQQPSNGTEVQALAIQSDGQIVAGGRAWGPAYYESRWLLARFSDAGEPDTTFGSEGTAELDPSTGHDVILGIVITDAGIHVAGLTETFDKGLAAARFDSSGRLDAGFGRNGMVGIAGVAAPSSRLAVQVDGRVVVAGSAQVFVPAFSVDVYVARYFGESAADTTPPVLTLPVNVVADAIDATGAAVSFLVSATDDVDPNPTVVCAPASGSIFPIGDTTVKCVANDYANNATTASFLVHVKGAAEQLADLAGAVAGIGPGTSLVDKVRDAQEFLGAQDDCSAVSTLNAFISEVRAQAGKSIPRSLASELVATTRRILSVLGDPSC